MTQEDPVPRLWGVLLAASFPVLCALIANRASFSAALPLPLAPSHYIHATPHAPIIPPIIATPLHPSISPSIRTFSPGWAGC